MGQQNIGHDPLWGGFAQDKWRSGGLLARLLVWPLILWEWVFYSSRVNVTTLKTDGAAWKVVQGDIRYLHAVFCYLGPPGHILWSIRWPLCAVMSVSLAMAGYEHARATCCPDLWEVDPTQMSYDAFRLSSFAMSLMLAFRLRATYDRWWTGRAGFTGVGGAAITLAQQAASYIDDPFLLHEFQRWCLLWQFTTYQFITSGKRLLPEAEALLRPAELELMNKTKKTRQVVALKLRSLIFEARLPTAQSQAMEASLARGWESQSMASRIRYQAMPQGASMMCTGFVMIWLMLLPLGIWGSLPQYDTANNWWGLLIMFVISTLLLGVDAVSNQMEHPWPLIPMVEYLKSTQRDIPRNIEEAQELRRLKQLALDSFKQSHVNGNQQQHQQHVHVVMDGSYDGAARYGSIEAAHSAAASM